MELAGFGCSRIHIHSSFAGKSRTKWEKTATRQHKLKFLYCRSASPSPRSLSLHVLINTNATISSIPVNAKANNVRTAQASSQRSVGSHWSECISLPKQLKQRQVRVYSILSYFVFAHTENNVICTDRKHICIQRQRVGISVADIQTLNSWLVRPSRTLS